MTLEDRLAKIEELLLVLVGRERVAEWYSVEEFARIVGRAEFTCREWCRAGRIRARKKESGRGAHRAWAIPREELLRYQREGLRPRGNRLSRLTPAHERAGLNDTSDDHEQAQ